MASLILKQMAFSLARRALHHNVFPVMLPTSASSSCRCLRTLSAAPCSLLLSPARIKPLPSPLPCVQPCVLPSVLPCVLPCVQPCAGMKTKTALKRRCKDCFFVRRRGRLFVFCKTHPRHKQRQG